MLYRKEEYVAHDESDSAFPIKQIDRLVEVDGDGQRFIGRAVLNMQTNMGIQQLPVSFEIEAATVQEAYEKYAGAALPKIEEVRQRIQSRIEEMQRQQQSKIVTPGGGGSGIISLDQFQGGN